MGQFDHPNVVHLEGVVTRGNHWECHDTAYPQNKVNKSSFSVYKTFLELTAKQHCSILQEALGTCFKTKKRKLVQLILNLCKPQDPRLILKVPTPFKIKIFTIAANLKASVQNPTDQITNQFGI